MGRSRKKLYSNILSIAIIPFLGLIGWLIGAYLGGNYAVGIKFIGLRGYEAAGLIGFLLGALLGLIIYTFLLIRSKQ